MHHSLMICRGSDVPLSTLGELQLIKQLSSIVNRSVPESCTGIGDDCAVVPLSEIPGCHSLLWTVDTLVEGRHFDFDLSSPRDIGFKLVAVSVSDIAAMGGEPRFVLVALQSPSNIGVDVIEEIYRGIMEAADSFGVAILGGNCTEATTFSLSSTVLGISVGKPLLRSGATVGDDLWVSGPIGAGYLGLSFAKGWSAKVEESLKQRCLERHRRPSPRIALAGELGRKGLATAAVDISDGLLQDCAHLAQHSGVTAVISLDSIPLAFPARTKSGKLDLSLIAQQIAGGDDYELLFTASPSMRPIIEELGGKLLTEQLSESLIGNNGISRIGTIQDGATNQESPVLIELEGKLLGVGSFLKDAGVDHPGYRHY